MVLQCQVKCVLIGQARPFGPRRVRSGIDKKAVDGQVRVNRLGLDGDEQGDTKHHGGPEKAIHHYPFEHYNSWKREYPQLACRLQAAGAVGENLSTTGMDENTVCIGDIFQLGTAVVQVSQGRQPCWKLNVRFDKKAMARRVQTTGRTGWYYRVLEEGDLRAGDVIKRLESLHADWPLSRLIRTLYVDTLDRRSLLEMSELSTLSDSWRNLAAKRLERAGVEDWSKRLVSPD